jgi:methanobactin biosynthesis cassette protein MbnB
LLARTNFFLRSLVVFHNLIRLTLRVLQSGEPIWRRQIKIYQEKPHEHQNRQTCHSPRHWPRQRPLCIDLRDDERLIAGSLRRSPSGRPAQAPFDACWNEGRMQMRLGFNFTLGDTYDMVQRLLAERHIDYCEFLIDNFFCVDPEEIARAFDCPIGLHIMYSKFLESDTQTLADFAARLREYIDALSPIYVSDHILRFSHNGRSFFHLGEVDYLAEYEFVRDRVMLWQEMVGQPVHFENYPSIMDGGREAPEFFERLTRETGAGVLFDASNAVCAMRNCGAPFEAWRNIISSATHFHVAGYRQSLIEPYISLDTHAEELAPDTMAFLKDYRSLFDTPNATMTYERDDQIEFDAIVADLKQLRNVFGEPKGNHDELVLAACPN